MATLPEELLDVVVGGVVDATTVKLSLNGQFCENQHALKRPIDMRCQYAHHPGDPSDGRAVGSGPQARSHPMEGSQTSDNRTAQMREKESRKRRLK